MSRILSHAEWIGKMAIDMMIPLMHYTEVTTGKHSIEFIIVWDVPASMTTPFSPQGLQRRRTMGDETNSGVLGRLGRLSTALDANAADLAHLEGVRLRLSKIVGDARGIAQQQAALTASKQDASKQFSTLLGEGQRLAAGMTKFLQQNYGTGSEKLAEFGLQPFRGRKARTPKEETPQTPAKPATAAAHAEADANPKP
jgi:hypothetical protein